MNSLRDLLTPLIAVISTWIAYQQFQTQRLKLKSDLFDKRFAVFETVLGFIGIVATFQQPTAQDVVNLDKAKITSFFLFGTEVPDYIESIRKRAANLNVLASNLNEIAELGGGQLASEPQAQRQASVDWFEELFSKCRNIFEKDLALHG